MKRKIPAAMAILLLGGAAASFAMWPGAEVVRVHSRLDTMSEAAAGRALIPVNATTPLHQREPSCGAAPLALPMPAKRAPTDT